MSKSLRDTWSESNCEELVQFDKLFSCNRRLGWGFLAYWLSKRSNPKPSDGIECITNNKANKFCRYTNVTIDFGKVAIRNGIREFSSGFVESHGTSPGKVDPPVPGYKHIPTSSLHPRDIGDCDSWESRPTFFLSNDDPFNLSHFMNEVIMVWSMLVLAGAESSESLLINMDGIRSGGPAGGPPHRIIKPQSPDDHGPFSAYFHSWFEEVKKGTEYGTRRVCFKEAYFQYFPGYPWFWGDWTTDNSCSFRGPSPLYQSFSLHLRSRWIAKYGLDSLPSPPTDVVHIVIELREINRQKRESFPRYIPNHEAMITAIREIPGVKVTVQSFSKIPFKEQVALSHSAGVFISMHGAGTANMFHAAVGKPNCCALIELFPDSSSHFHSIRGFGNLGRHYGMHYYRYDSLDGQTTAQGTVIDVQRLVKIVKQAVSDVQVKPTCLNNATERTVGEFLANFPAPMNRLPPFPRPQR
jgi:hypothetical protein